MTKKQLTLKSVEALKEAYPEAICSLVYSDPLQLLIATRLSAQCTDARVNLVVPKLYEQYPSVEALAKAIGRMISNDYIGIATRGYNTAMDFSDSKVAADYLNKIMG